MKLSFVTIFFALFVLINGRPLTLSFTADNEATVYVNGKIAASIAEWQWSSAVTMNLNNGDVIFIVAKDYYGGYMAIAALGKCVSKVGRGPWKADKLNNDSLRVWSTPASNRGAGTLPNPSASQGTPRTPFFPYSTGAEYVWATGAGESDSIFLRLIVSDAC